MFQYSSDFQTVHSHGRESCTVSGILPCCTAIGFSTALELTNGRYLKHPDWDVRKNAAAILGQLGEAAAPAVPLLVKCPQDPRTPHDLGRTEGRRKRVGLGVTAMYP